VPGGRVEAGERLESAVEREVREETGLTVSCGSLLGWVQRLGESHNFVILDFEATLDPTHAVLPALEPGDDASAARWVHVDRLAEMRLVPGLLDFLIEHGVVPRYSSSSSGTSASSVDDSAD
jgi:ADP-ribose pyrophosphatase YjhB (NUDIX family)